MRAIMVMYDSLNRRFLESYGCDFTKTPNFKRLQQSTVTFDNFYVASLPCMPARRDLHTGRYNFLHRSWGPIEPFDNSMPRILRENGIFTRLVSDHGHYWEDGGCTYHTMYSSWDAVRGQEGDPWSMQVGKPHVPEHLDTMREFTHHEWWEDNWHNRERLRAENKWPQNMVFENGLEFIEKNKSEDNWFLQIETFDPHEPFDVPQEYQDLYKDDYSGKHFDWPPYAPVSESEEVVQHTRALYSSLLSMCDQNLGRVLDMMDKYNMWEDTMLIVNTDHGFLLGEKDWWAKSVMPCYNELANTPFFLWDPRVGEKNKRVSSLCQSIDIPATLLDYFDASIPSEMRGKPLQQVLKEDKPVREYALFGFHGSFVNITDGRYLYMRASESISNKPLNEYTLMPTHQQGLFTSKELANAEMVDPLPFTKGCRIMKIPTVSKLANATFCNSFQYGHLLFDLKNDPEQLDPINHPEIEAKMINEMIQLMKINDAPVEQYERLGLDSNRSYTEQLVIEDRKKAVTFETFAITKKYSWTDEAKNIFVGMLSLLDESQIDEYFNMIETLMAGEEVQQVTRKQFEILAHKFYSENEQKSFYFLNKLARVQ